MDELIKALTRAANAVAVYYETAAGTVRRVDAGAAVEAPAGEAAPKPRKARTPKEAEAPAAIPPAAPVAPAAAAPSGAAVVEPSEEDSLKEVRALAKTYVQRFANQVDGIKSFRELIAATTGVARIDDLVHSQRLLVIAKAKSEIAKKDVKPAAPVETSGTAV